MREAFAKTDAASDKLTVQGVHKRFGREEVLRGSSLEVPIGKTLSVLGRSGSGKTTLLKIIAGLETADAGEVRLGGEVIDALPPAARNIVYLYQEALLFPHLTVRDNIAFGLRIRKTPSIELRAQVDEMLAALDLEGQAHKLPDQLSGGQRQRVAFGRALVVRPRVMLLDEPFGALDVETRADMQALYTRMAALRGITAVFVTHDLKEALIMGQQLAVMQGGQLTHYATREAFVADETTGVGQEMEFWRKLNENLR